jgi:hypothetical protein
MSAKIEYDQTIEGNRRVTTFFIYNDNRPIERRSFNSEVQAWAYADQKGCPGPSLRAWDADPNEQPERRSFQIESIREAFLARGGVEVPCPDFPYNGFLVREMISH